MLCGRMEPLILEGAELRRPVFAAYAKGGRRLHVGMQEMGGVPSHCSDNLAFALPSRQSSNPCRCIVGGRI